MTHLAHFYVSLYASMFAHMLVLCLTWAEIAALGIIGTTPPTPPWPSHTSQSAQIEALTKRGCRLWAGAPFGSQAVAMESRPPHDRSNSFGVGGRGHRVKGSEVGRYVCRSLVGRRTM